MICLDPGHGGTDNGAESKGIKEKNINLKVAKQIESWLIQKNVDYLVTRHEDITMTLKSRVELAHDLGSELFVSVHSNWFKKSSVGGYEVHHYPSSHSGREMAKSIHGCLSKQDYISSRPIKKSDFYVLRETEIPAVLIELGFLSNDKNRNVLNSAKKTFEISEKIAQAISWYRGDHKP